MAMHLRCATLSSSPQREARRRGSSLSYAFLFTLLFGCCALVLPSAAAASDEHHQKTPSSFSSVAAAAAAAIDNLYDDANDNAQRGEPATATEVVGAAASSAPAASLATDNTDSEGAAVAAARGAPDDTGFEAAAFSSSSSSSANTHDDSVAASSQGAPTLLEASSSSSRSSSCLAREPLREAPPVTEITTATPTSAGDSGSKESAATLTADGNNVVVAEEEGADADEQQEGDREAHNHHHHHHHHHHLPNHQPTPSLIAAEELALQRAYDRLERPHVLDTQHNPHRRNLNAAQISNKNEEESSSSSSRGEEAGNGNNINSSSERLDYDDTSDDAPTATTATAHCSSCHSSGGGNSGVDDGANNNIAPAPLLPIARGGATPPPPPQEAPPPPAPQCQHFDDLSPLLRARILQNRLTAIGRAHQRAVKAAIEASRGAEEALLRRRDAHLSRVAGFWHTAMASLPNYPIYSLPFQQQLSDANVYVSPVDLRAKTRVRRAVAFDDAKIFRYHLRGMQCRRFVPALVIPQVEEELRRLRGAGGGGGGGTSSSATTAAFSSASSAGEPLESLLESLRRLDPHEEQFNITFDFAPNSLLLGSASRRLLSDSYFSDGDDGDNDTPPPLAPTSSAPAAVIRRFMSLLGRDGLPVAYDNADSSSSTSAPPTTTDPTESYPFTAEQADDGEREGPVAGNRQHFRYFPKYFPFHQQHLTKFIAVSSALRSSRRFGDASFARDDEEEEMVRRQHAAPSRGGGGGGAYTAIAQGALEAYHKQLLEEDTASEVGAVAAGMTMIDDEMAQHQQQQSQYEASPAKGKGDEDLQASSLTTLRTTKSLNGDKKQRAVTMNRQDRLNDYLRQYRSDRAIRRRELLAQKQAELDKQLEAEKLSRLSEVQKNALLRRHDNHRHEFGVGSSLSMGSGFIGVERDDVIPYVTGMNWAFEGRGTLFSAGRSLQQVESRRRLFSNMMPVAGSFFSFFLPPAQYEHYSENERSVIKLRLYALLSDVCGPLAARPIDVYDAYFIEEAFRREHALEEERAAAAHLQHELDRMAFSYAAAAEEL